MKKETVQKVMSGAVFMENYIEVLVPSTIDINTAHDTSAYVEEGLRILAQEFGGASCEDVRGYWVTESGALVEDLNKKVYAYASDVTEEQLARVLLFIEKLKRDLKQEAIGFKLVGDGFNAFGLHF